MDRRHFLSLIPAAALSTGAMADNVVKLKLSPFGVLTRAIHHDAGYAWTWQANLAVAIYEASREPDRAQANKQAAHIMSRFFGIDMTKNPSWNVAWSVEPRPKDDPAEVIQKMIDIQAIDGNWDHSPYMRGMLNGLLCAQSAVTGVEPVYVPPPKKYVCEKGMLDGPPTVSRRRRRLAV
jgi:hypothetical protein